MITSQLLFALVIGYLLHGNLLCYFGYGKKPDYFSKKRKTDTLLPIEKYLLAETKEKFFEIRKIKSIEVMKIKVHSKWANHFKLIEDASEWGRIFFTDTGTSESLIASN